MKIEGDVKIQGDSLVDRYKNAIDLISVDLDIKKPMLRDKSSNIRGTDRPELSDFVVKMRLNKSYPLMCKACTLSQHLGTVTVHFTKVENGSTVDVLVYTLTNTFVGSVYTLPESESGKVTEANSDSTLPLIEIGLNYQSIEVVYQGNGLGGDQSGNVSSGQMTGLGAANA